MVTPYIKKFWILVCQLFTPQRWTYPEYLYIFTFIKAITYASIYLPGIEGFDIIFDFSKNVLCFQKMMQVPESRKSIQLGKEMNK